MDPHLQVKTDKRAINLNKGTIIIMINYLF